MKLLELMPLLEKYGRIRRSDWSDMFLVKSLDDKSSLILCDLESMIIKRYCFSYQDLISEDWEILN